jgi:hypothetical protein
MVAAAAVAIAACRCCCLLLWRRPAAPTAGSLQAVCVFSLLASRPAAWAPSAPFCDGGAVVPRCRGLQVLGEEPDVLNRSLVSIGVKLRRADLHLGACLGRLWGRCDGLCPSVVLVCVGFLEGVPCPWCVSHCPA